MSESKKSSSTLLNIAGTALSIVGAVASTTTSVISHCIPGDKNCESERSTSLGADWLGVLEDRKKK